MPAECPDLSNHSSYFAEVMRANPELYAQLKDKTTSLGVNLGTCIKTGIDNPGHPMIKTVGMVAGDEESYTLFAPLFDPVISARHNGYPADAKHPTDMNIDNISDTKIDPTGKYVLTTRCRTGRSIRGTRLPPSCSFEERREIERMVVKGLLTLDGELKGDYFPLTGSQSYAPKPTGMSPEKEESLRSNGNLFQEPDSTLLLSSGKPSYDEILSLDFSVRPYLCRIMLHTGNQNVTYGMSHSDYPTSKLWKLIRFLFLSS